MTDNPSPILLMREQSTGSNTNLWGGYVITDLRMLEQAAKGYQTLSVTGDATISWTNYITGNTGQCARLKLTGALTANATLTFPSYMNFMSTDNATTGGFAVTVKCSGGTGVSIANGAKVDLYCDGVDYYNAAPTVFPAGITVAGAISGVTAGVATTDATNVAQVAAAIAAAGTLTPATVRVTINDTTADYLGQKIAVAGDLALTTQTPGANEKALVTHTPYWNAPRSLTSANSPITALDRDILRLNTNAAITVNFPASGRVKIVDASGTAQTFNVTLVPAGADTTTFDVIDTDYFSGEFYRTGTNWDLT